MVSERQIQTWTLAQGECHLHADGTGRQAVWRIPVVSWVKLPAHVKQTLRPVNQIHSDIKHEPSYHQSECGTHHSLPTGVKLQTHPKTEQKELKCDLGCSSFCSRSRWVMISLTVWIILLYYFLYDILYFEQLVISQIYSKTHRLVPSINATLIDLNAKD